MTPNMSREPVMLQEPVTFHVDVGPDGSIGRDLWDESVRFEGIVGNELRWAARQPVKVVPLTREAYDAMWDRLVDEFAGRPDRFDLATRALAALGLESVAVAKVYPMLLNVEEAA